MKELGVLVFRQERTDKDFCIMQHVEATMLLYVLLIDRDVHNLRE